VSPLDDPRGVCWTLGRKKKDPAWMMSGGQKARVLAALLPLTLVLLPFASSFHLSPAAPATGLSSRSFIALRPPPPHAARACRARCPVLQLAMSSQPNVEAQQEALIKKMLETEIFNLPQLVSTVRTPPPGDPPGMSSAWWVSGVLTSDGNSFGNRISGSSFRAVIVGCDWPTNKGPVLVPVRPLVGSFSSPRRKPGICYMVGG